jgi:acyl-CoA hydrolase
MIWVLNFFQLTVFLFFNSEINFISPVSIGDILELSAKPILFEDGIIHIKITADVLSLNQKFFLF